MDNTTNQTKRTPTEAFDASIANIENIMNLLQERLEALKQDQKGQPHRWDIAGEAARIESKLLELCK